MVGVVKTRLREGAVLALTNPLHTKVLEYFVVVALAGEKGLTIEDSDGRRFSGYTHSTLWVHPQVMFEALEPNQVGCNKDGYFLSTRIHVNDNLRIHFMDWLEKENVECFNKLPFKLRKGV